MARSPARVRLLIDGYNLLHATDVQSTDALAGTLQGARQALLTFLAARLSRRERSRATIVFDAAGAPPGLPDELGFEGIRVLFARKYPDADAMLEALIETDRAPKELLVVSGDRRVQRAARQRGAAWEESSAWNRELLRRPAHPVGGPVEKPPAADIGDADYWVGEFSRPLPPDQGEHEPFDPRRSGSDAPPPAADAPGSPPAAAEDADNPFPPGYADDLAAELEKPARRHPRQE